MFETDLVNIIKWSKPPTLSPISYLIYRDPTLTKLAGKVSAKHRKFKDHHRKKGISYSYYIVAVEETGAQTTIGSVTIKPHS